MISTEIKPSVRLEHMVEVMSRLKWFP